MCVEREREREVNVKKSVCVCVMWRQDRGSSPCVRVSLWKRKGFDDTGCSGNRAMCVHLQHETVIDPGTCPARPDPPPPSGRQDLPTKKKEGSARVRCSSSFM
jgi:hypothetical protein